MNKTVIALLLGTVFTGTAFSQAVLYRYKDASGNTIYTDSVPPSQKGQVDVLSSKTMSLKRITERQLTPQEIEERKTVEKEQQTAQVESNLVKQKNQSLLTTYSSVKDIDSMKDYELQQINRAISNDTDAVSTLSDRKSQLDKEISDANNKVPDKVTQEYRAVENNIKSAEENLKKNKTLYEQREKKYNEDKAQYLQLLQKMTAQAKQ